MGTVFSEQRAGNGGTSPAPIVEMLGICKTFGAVTALADVDFDVISGEVHALVGENGAGKSTLIKVLVGAHLPTAGRILLDGREVAVSSPRNAAQLGILAVYQELSVLPNRSVAQNLLVSQEPTRWGFVRKRVLQRSAEEILERVGLDVSPDTLAGDLGAGARQLLEVARCVARDARVIVMDEPNSRLSASESEDLFAIINQLRSNGISVIYISHRLDDLQRIADRVTVLRDGRKVGVFPMAAMTQARLVEQMLGVQLQEEGISHRSAASDDSGLLELADLTAPPHFRGVSLSVRRHEVLGLYGLLDAGQREVGRALVGLVRGVTGAASVDGKVFDCRSRDAARRAGLAFISDDRRGEGVIGPLSITRNTVVSVLAQLTRAGLVEQRKGERMVTDAIDHFDIKPARPRTYLENMSGGNQQKVLLARALLTKPRVLVCAEPTQGIDVKAKAEIHRSLRTLAEEGMPSLVISSDLADIARMCDRVAVMRRGEIVGIVDTSAATASADILGLSLGG